MRDQATFSRREFVAMAVGAAGGMVSGCVTPPYWYWEEVQSTEAAPIVIIGSGVTGLCLGGLLARAGHSVVILESHPSLIGGHARVLEVGGLAFSAGPQYVWHFGQDDIGSRVLHYLGDATRVPFESMDPDGFDNIISDDALPFAVPLGIHRWKEALVSRHPEAENSIERFFEIYDALWQGLRVVYDQGLYLQSVADMWAAVFLSPHVSAYAKDIMNKCVTWTLNELFDRCEVPVPVRRLLYGQAGLFAENTNAVSAAVYVAATAQLLEGASFPSNGFGSLLEYLTGACTSNGGAIHLGKRVTRLRVDGKRVREVQCADGTKVPCGFVVSTLAPGLTCSFFSEPNAYRLGRYEPSRSAVSCFFTVSNYDDVASQLAGRNYWYEASGGETDFTPTDVSRPPSYLYIGSNTANSPSLSAGAPGLHGLTVCAPGSFGAWEQAWAKGESHYADAKEQAALGVIDALERALLPNVGTHVEESKVLTPYDLHLEIGCDRGAVYGRRLTPGSVLEAATPRFNVENIAIGCAAVGLPGVAVCFKTASLLFESLTGCQV